REYGSPKRGREHESPKRDQSEFKEFFDQEFFDACDEILGGQEEEAMSASASAVASSAAPLSEAGIAMAYGVSLSCIQELMLQFPDCPPAEISRFLCRKSVGGSTKKAAALLKTYLKWRQEELAQWPPDPPGMPRILRFNGYGRDGSRLILMLPCMIDTDFKPQEYSRAMVRGIESVIGRESTTRFTVLADTRGHQALGFEGKAVFKIWSHLAAMSKAFQTYFPERLRRFIVYPAGDVEMGAYRLFKALISKETVKRVTVLAHPLGSNAPKPPSELLEFLDPKEVWPENSIFFTGLSEADVAAGT
ncbi:unnamed protein product, partial [Polarella glacialis]